MSKINSFFQNITKDKHVIITIILCFTFLFAGWTAGSSFAYRSGYADAEKQQNKTQLNEDKVRVTTEIEALLAAARTARHNLLIRYKGETVRDFLTLLSAHMKGAGQICSAYMTLDTDKALMNYCKNAIIPQVKDNRNFMLNYLNEQGLNSGH
ncbi:MAG: hypothetical protein AAF621_04010 [Pseudomonadota bacterium]